jgi:hypothetical protein
LPLRFRALAIFVRKCHQFRLLTPPSVISRQDYRHFPLPTSRLLFPPVIRAHSQSGKARLPAQLSFTYLRGFLCSEQ